MAEKTYKYVITEILEAAQLLNEEAHDYSEEDLHTHLDWHDLITCERILDGMCIDLQNNRP